MLFGIIAAAGIRMLIEAKTDFSQKNNLILASVILIIGIGGAKISIAELELEGMALATIVGILLNLVINYFIPWLRKTSGLKDDVAM